MRKRRAFGGKMKNIVLIGMPGGGKSTVGVILAKTLGTYFIDTDLIIQVQQKNTLQQLIDLYGIERFLDFEEEAVLSVDSKQDTVIATGGSAVFREGAMKHLKENGVVIYLDLPVAELERRLSNIKTRGVACKKGESISDIFAERSPYYEKHADIKIDCTNKTPEEIVEKIVEKVEKL